MFSIQIDNLAFQDVNNFCQTRVREGLILDYKRDFPKRLDKTIASFANTYGGHILIGVDETPTGEPVLPIAGVPLQPGLRERVVATALDAIYPPVYPEVRVIEFQAPGAQTPDRAVVVVRVHESEVSAHAVDGGTSVYLRVDNISDQFTRRATTDEIAWFLNKRQRSIELKDRLLREAERRASNYVISYRTAKQLSTAEPKGRYVLWTVPTFPRSELASPQRLLQLSRSQGWKQHSGDFAFPVGSASPIADGIRHPQSPGFDYWYTEVNRFGLVYTQVGFPQTKEEYKDAIGCSLVVRLLMSSLRFSLVLYDTLGYCGLVDFHFTASPTRNRYPHVQEGESYSEHRSLEDTVTLAFSGSAKELRELSAAHVKQSYQEFLWAFGLNADDATASNHFRIFGVS